jgi:hypothetical protein
MQRADRAPEFLRELQQEFIEANTTMHLLLSSSRTMGKLASVYMRETNVHSDWQEAFRNISEATGGGIIDSNLIKQALHQAVEKEDIYYRLTFAPRKSDKSQRQIRLKPNDKSLQLEYHQKVRLTSPGEIAIEHFSYQHPALAFTLKNYRQFFDGSRLYGDIGIKVTGVDSRGEITSFHREFEPDRHEMAVSLKVNFPAGGKYSLILEAFDRQTGKAAAFSQKVDVPGRAGELKGPVLITSLPSAKTGVKGGNRLARLLDRAAGYCEKLRKATFYFICNEEVTDSYYIRGEQVKEDRYYYDYQILMEEKGMRERRELRTVEKGEAESKKRKKQKRGRKFKHPPKPRIEITNFFSKYPFLMPISMFAKENQRKFHFRLLESEMLQGRRTWKVSVEPRGGHGNRANYGVVWLDDTDGSVLKIRLHPHSMAGVEKLKHTARRKGTQLKIEDVHWFEIRRRGIRFPSRTEISGSYLAPKPRNFVHTDDHIVEKMSTRFSYNSYRFFNVNIDILDPRIPVPGVKR